jgi:hypothetical protein
MFLNKQMLIIQVQYQFYKSKKFYKNMISRLLLLLKVYLNSPKNKNNKMKPLFKLVQKFNKKFITALQDYTESFKRIK